MATANANERPSWNERMTKGAAAFFSAALVAGVSAADGAAPAQLLAPKKPADLQ